MDPNTKNIIDYTNSITIGKKYGAVRQISKLTHLNLRPWKENYASIYSNISTARKLRSSEKSEQTQFAQLWIAVRHDFKNSQYFFTEY